jgi:hypothetical protein
VKYRIVDMPIPKEARKSRYYDLVTELLEAYKQGKGVEVTFEEGDYFSTSALNDHLRRRTWKTISGALQMRMRSLENDKAVFWAEPRREKKEKGEAGNPK